MTPHDSPPAGVDGAKSGVHAVAGGSTTVVVDPRRLFWTVFLGCVAIEILFVYLDVSVNYLRGSNSGPIRRLFNTAREDSLPAWFAITQTFVVALVAWAAYVLARKRRSSRLSVYGWFAIAAFFTYLSADDGAAIHERLGSYANTLDETTVVGSAVTRFPSYAWQVLFMPIFGTFGIFILYFLWRELPRWADRLRVLAALGLLGMAVAIDFVEGLDDGYDWLIWRTGWSLKAVQHFSKSGEEFIEMLAMTLLLVTFLGHITRAGHDVILRFRTPDSDRAH